MAKTFPICVNVNGKDIMFFAELGLSNAEYTRMAVDLYNKYYNHKTKGERALELFVEILKSNKPISNFSDQIKALGLDSEEEYDYGHLIARAKGLLFLED